MGDGVGVAVGEGVGVKVLVGVDVGVGTAVKVAVGMGVTVGVSIESLLSSDLCPDTVVARLPSDSEVQAALAMTSSTKMAIKALTRNLTYRVLETVHQGAHQDYHRKKE